MLTPALSTTAFQLVVYRPANPGAGNYLEWTPDTNTRAQIIAVDFTLNTSATVANRRVYLRFYSATYGLHYAYQTHNQPAGGGKTYHWAIKGAVLDLTATHTRIFSKLPIDYLLTSGDTFRIYAHNFQAGDNLVTIRIRAKVWIMD